jgi:hypothetical protein
MHDMNIAAQRLCVWCGPIMIATWLAAFVFLAKFIPPPDPAQSRAELVAQFSDHTDLIRLGLVISLFACALLVPFCAVIAAQMRRIEGGRSVLAETQLVSGGLLCVEFLIPFAIWQTALYRIDQWNPETVQMLNDMAWLMFLGIICSACVQVASLGIAILRDKNAQPVFPRWLGYFNLWVALIWVPAGWIPFFKHGAFAWNGMFAFWLPLSVYGLWFALMVVYLNKAIAQDERHQIQAERVAAAGTHDPAPLAAIASGT